MTKEPKKTYEDHALQRILKTRRASEGFVCRGLIVGWSLSHLQVGRTKALAAGSGSYHQANAPKDEAVKPAGQSSERELTNPEGINYFFHWSRIGLHVQPVVSGWMRADSQVDRPGPTTIHSVRKKVAGPAESRGPGSPPQ